MAERNIFRGVNSIKFNWRFKDDNDCLEYLAELKWLDGFICKRCNNDKRYYVFSFWQIVLLLIARKLKI